jgi:uncharacterized membrane protein
MNNSGYKAIIRSLTHWVIHCNMMFLQSPLMTKQPKSQAELMGLVYGFLGIIIYRGLMLGGIARVGQLQLFQTFLTILASAILLGEKISIETIGFAIGVICCVALGKRTFIQSKA